jgi:hypothetical protein
MSRYGRRELVLGGADGKRPLSKRWQLGQSPATRELLRAKYPDANTGCLTGDGLVVLDVDVRSEGFAALARRERTHGSLPETFTVITGSGGRHFYFRDRSRSLPSYDIDPGIEVKAAGRQVVAPPSINPIMGRAYVDDPGGPSWGTFAELPTWIALLAPRVEPKPARRQARVAGDFFETLSPGPLRLRPGGLAAGSQRLHPLPVAARQAGQRSVVGAVRHGRGRLAMLPRLLLPARAESCRWRHLPVHGPHGGLHGRAAWSCVPDDPRGGRTPVRAPTPGRAMSEGMSHAERDRLEATLGQNGTGPAVAPFTVYSADALADLPAPSYLVHNYVVARALTVLYGGPGVYKSFVALDWALCIATGIPWGEHAVQPGAVLYIAAEGFSGLLRRVDAWCEEHEQPRPPSIHFLPEVVNLLDVQDLERAYATIDSLPERPVLTVIDTLARAMPGGEENSAKDMGKVIDEARRLALYADGASLAIHHTGVEGNRERGSSTLRGAADAMHLLKLDGADRLLEVTKMKDAEPTGPLRLSAAKVRDSLVLRRESSRTGLGLHERQILAALSQMHGGDETSTTRLQQTCEEEYGLSKASFYRARSLLVEGGFIHKVSERRNVYNALSPAGRDALLSTALNGSHETRPTTLTVPGSIDPDDGSGPDGGEREWSL